MRSRHDGFVPVFGACHGRRGPALDLPVQAAAAPDVDTQAAVVVAAGVLPHGARVVSLERRAPELGGVSLRDVEPEPLRRVDIGGLVDLHAVDQPVALDASNLEEPQEELDQRRVAVREDDLVASAVGLAFGAFAPVGDGSSDEDLAVVEPPDLGSRGRASRLPLGLADGAFGCPVSADALDGPLVTLLVAQSLRAGQVSDPK